MTPPAGAGAAGDEGLRAALGKALEAATAVYPGPPPLRILRGDLGWVVDALLPEVSAYAERRAAAELEAAADEIGAVTRIVGSPAPLVAVLRARAAALTSREEER